jgi:hypothetical protein
LHGKAARALCSQKSRGAIRARCRHVADAVFRAVASPDVMELLRHTPFGLIEVEARVGDESDAAFGRALKR